MNDLEFARTVQAWAYEKLIDLPNQGLGEATHWKQLGYYEAMQDLVKYMDGFIENAVACADSHQKAMGIVPVQEHMTETDHLLHRKFPEHSTKADYLFHRKFPDGK